MTLYAEGLRDTKSKDRAAKGGREESNQAGQKWWSTSMPETKIAIMFNMFVRST